MINGLQKVGELGVTLIDKQDEIFMTGADKAQTVIELIGLGKISEVIEMIKTLEGYQTEFYRNVF